MKAQLSIFIIVGLVLVATVTILFAVTNAAQPETQQPDVEQEDATNRVCVQSATRSALDAITTSQHAYISDENPSTFLLGRNTYKGLCDREGPNAIQTGGDRYSCPPSTYARPGTISVQEELQTRISQEISDCTGSNTQAEVIIRTDEVLVRTGNISLRREAPLTSIWAAIADITTNETKYTDYQPPATITACDACQEVSITSNSDSYTLSVDDYAVTIKTDNRPLLLADPIRHQDTYDAGGCEQCTISVYSPDGDQPTTNAQDDDITSTETGRYEISACGSDSFTISDGNGHEISVTNYDGGSCA